MLKRLNKGDQTTNLRRDMVLERDLFLAIRQRRARLDEQSLGNRKDLFEGGNRLTRLGGFSEEILRYPIPIV